MDVIKEAVLKNDLNSIIYFHKHNYQWNKDSILIATANNYYDCLKYLLQMGPLLKCSATVVAADNGHLECLRLLYGYYGWSGTETYYAAEKGHLECLKYLNENGCAVNSTTLAYSMEAGQGECTEYIKKFISQ